MRKGELIKAADGKGDKVPSTNSPKASYVKTCQNIEDNRGDEGGRERWCVSIKLKIELAVRLGRYSRDKSVHIGRAMS